MASTPPDQTIELSGDVAPVDLLDAFWDYDRALLANDVDALDAAFSESAGTLRGDGATLVVGHTAIARFRASRKSVPTRRVRSINLQLLSEVSALIVAEVASVTGTAGMQTQIWRRGESGWKVTAAHVTAPAAVIDGSVWRVAGNPLVPARESGALTGETIAVKDVYAITGQVVGGGVREFAAQAFPETHTASAVSMLLKAGASITGLAQSDQFAYSIAGTNPDYGTPLNVAEPTRIPGGSSSGSTTAVARGWSSVGLGTDTAGSIRVPAAYQGLWGIRTSHGLISTDGILPLAPSFDTVGWVTRDSKTLAKVAVPLLPNCPATVGETQLVTIPQLNQLASSGIRDEINMAAGRLGAVPVTLDGDLELWFAAFRTVQAHEAWQVYGAWITRNPSSLGMDVAERFDQAAAVSAVDAAAARAVLDEALYTIRSALHGFTLILPTTAELPTLLGASPDTINDDRARTLRLTCLASIAGVPAVTAPLLNVDGSSAGLCFMGQVGADLQLIDTASRYADQLNG